MEPDIESAYSMTSAIQHFVTGTAACILVVAVIFIMVYTIRSGRRRSVNSNMAAYVKWRLDDMAGRKKR